MKNKKIFDKNRSEGSKSYKIFGALTCDECIKPSKKLYQFELEDGEPSEDSYCEKCFNKLFL